MKRSLPTILLIIVSATAIISLCSWDYAPLEPTSHNSTNITADENWILIGEVTLSNYNNSSETIKANLYVREIANNLIYRVEYQGTYYATRWHDYSKTYHVTINGITYRCDVPAVSTGNDNETPKTKKVFEGVWNATDKDGYISSISITSNGEKYLVKIKSYNKLFTTNEAYVNNGKIHGSVLEFKNYGEWKISNYYNSGNTCYVTEIEGYKTSRISEIPKRNVSDYSQKATFLDFVMYFEGEIKDGDLKIHAWHTFEWGRQNYRRMFFEDTPAQIYQTFTNW